jgi:YesN/AraC family two-component response regulator
MEVVAEATDGQQALELALSLKPDLVLMDVWMPRMGGLAATLP